MKCTKLLLGALLMLTLHQTTHAQSGNWAKAGNSLSGTEKLGSTNGQPVRFFTKNLQRMTLDTGGNLGIGTKKPIARLHVFRGSGVGLNLVGGGSSTIVTESSDDNFVTVLAPAGKRTGIVFGSNINVEDGGIVYNSPLALRGLQFNTTFATRMTITDKGFIGMGTTAPKAPLHVFKGSSGTTPFSSAPLVVENSGTNFINLLNPTSSASGLLFGNVVNNADGGIIYSGEGTTRGLQFNTGGNATRMVLTSNGRVGIGTKNPFTDIHIVHPNSASFGGFVMENAGANHHMWQFFVHNETGDLDIISKTAGLVSFIDDHSGGYFALSDARRKKNIEAADAVLPNVLKLDVKKYHFLTNKPTDAKYYGMLAQDVEKLFPELVMHLKADKRDVYAVNYAGYGVIAIKAIQEQQKKIESLEERIAKLETLLNNAVSKNGSGDTNPSSFKGDESGSMALEQNQPNPFRQSTIIRYQLPQASTGQINIYSLNGVLIKSIKASSTQAVVNSSDLKAGTYTYTLSVDGSVIGSRKMVVLK